MKPVTIIRHIACEGPGYLEKVLQQHQVDYNIIAIDEQQSLPLSVDNMRGLVIMGGSMSVNDKDGWIGEETRLIRQAIEQNLPVLGHCLGGQFIARALDAPVVQNPVKEIGWLPVRSTSTAREPAWHDLFSTPQVVFHWHGETFQLPDGANCILSSEHCENQAFVYKDNVYAFQCHIEMTCDMVDEWSTLYADEIGIPSATIQDHVQMTTACRNHIGNLHRLSDSIYAEWINKLEAS